MRTLRGSSKMGGASWFTKTTRKHKWSMDVKIWPCNIPNHHAGSQSQTTSLTNLFDDSAQCVSNYHHIPSHCYRNRINTELSMTVHSFSIPTDISQAQKILTNQRRERGTVQMWDTSNRGDQRQLWPSPGRRTCWPRRHQWWGGWQCSLWWWPLGQGEWHLWENQTLEGRQVFLEKFSNITFRIL